MKKELCIFLSLSFYASSAESLPLGFGFPQGDRVYHQTTNPNFLIYHDSKTPHEARMILDTLESARPVMNQWFLISRKSPMPVISSAMSENASFANFITGAMELQTLGQGQRDLFWHEYVHMMMFLHLENFMGHAGVIFHIPWMPAWFLEGLAEALSVSVSSERQSIVERKQAINNTWPTYNRLHSLYAENSIFETGYGTSGAFVAWLLRKGYAQEKDFLPVFLKLFYRYTLPHYYPVSATPISDFLPMDEVLKDAFGKNGRELYEDYKKEATAHWKAHRKHTFIEEASMKKKENIFLGYPNLKSDRKAYLFQSNESQLEETDVYFEENGEVKERKATGNLYPRDTLGMSTHGDYTLAVQTTRDFKNGLPHYRIVFLKQDDKTYSFDKVLLEREGRVYRVGESIDKIYWTEEVYEVSQICYVDKSDLQDRTFPLSSDLVHCPISATLPKSISYLGSDFQPGSTKSYTKNIWYAVHEQTIEGDRHEVWEWNFSKATQLHVSNDIHALSTAKTTNAQWILFAERTHRSLMKTDKNGECLGMLALDEDVSSISSLDDDLIFTISLDKMYTLRRINAQKIPMQKCRPVTTHTSPLLVAMNSKVDLGTALEEASLWKKDTKNTDNKGVGALGSGASKSVVSEDQPAEWKPRPILALPWIGANDALGYQLGVISVPLMDHMQNETVYASLLYGMQSQYPNTEITVISSRFWPQLSLSAYRRQVWNGTFKLSNDDIVSSYIDEKGTRLAMYLTAYFPWMNVSLMGGLITAKRDPYIGPTTVASKGTLVEPFASLNFMGRVHKLSWLLGFDAFVAPASWNKHYDFNSLGVRMDVKQRLGLLDSTLGFNGEAARTRGDLFKTPFLKQAYFPIKTFVAGTGSKYTKNSYPFIGSGKLLRGELGDTKARAELNWTFPVIKDWDKLTWILYFYELRFSTFVNYGGAWYQSERPKDRMFVSHGHSLDMYFDNKGVQFNLGLGLGQSVPGPGQIYLNAGFDMML